MFFKKKIERSCLYCSYSTKLGEDQILCTKRGIVSTDHKCRKFEYDPFKRIPSRPKAPNFSKYEDQDCSL